MKKLVTVAAVSTALVVGPATAASAGDLDRIQTASGSAEVQSPQEAAWEALVFGGLLVTYGIGTAIVGT